ncbi:2807_t:CDS:1, partial [Funneliformis geosporum]
IIATIKVNIDYPEYDGVEYLTGKQVLSRLNNLVKKLINIKESGKKAGVFQARLKIAIAGKPNVGKSTLLNTLLQEEKAIVSPLAGTTRDIVEAHYNLKGVPLTLLDTAGIHETQDIVEKIGVKRSYQALEKAEIIFFLVDNSACWGKEDENIYQKIKLRNYLLIINKIDEPSRLQIPALVPAEKIVRISAKNKQLTQLENKIKELFASDLLRNLPSYPVLSQSWQQGKLAQLISQLSTIVNELKKEVYLDAICSSLENSYKLARELSGKEYKENLLDIIFSKFCLGK